MKVDFVRHGQTKNNVLGVLSVFAGHTDAPLNEEGRRQAQETASKISNDYSIIYSSDLIRCKQTAEILNAKMNLPIKYDARLRERHFGTLEGKKSLDVDPTGVMKEKDLTHNDYDYRPFGGEHAGGVKERLFEFLEDVKKETGANRKILVVTHGGIIRIMHQVLKGKIPETIHNASVHEFEF